MGKTHWSIRALSLTLAICLLLGTVPTGTFTLPVFAAGTDSTVATTSANVNTVKTYAQNLLTSNYDQAGSEDPAVSTDKFSWDAEGNKKTNWRYYTGVMLDAFVMLGVDAPDKGNALEFAKSFMDTNVDPNGNITYYIPDEVDSVPPALMLLYLLDSVLVDDDRRADYETAANWVYDQIMDQTPYAQCGGNLLHKQDSNGNPSSGWENWNIALDGLYMAQVFLMEYANALAAGKITNTDADPAEIYAQVYERFMWVADYMYDSATGLYHHAWDVTRSKGNGVFWGRAIGWYAVALVEIIDRMPEGPYKTGLKGKLPKLFDGMLQYQDETTGMWYNIVNHKTGISNTNDNCLETSVTSLMSYAMLKAYTEGWVTDGKYGEKGLKAFNGLVANKYKDGKFVDIYLKSGAGDTLTYYCGNSYVADEAKGVGAILMAAAQANQAAAKLNNGSVPTEKFVGVVSAPYAVVKTSNSEYSLADEKAVTVTVLGDQGTMLTLPGDHASLSYTCSDPSGDAGTSEVTVYYNGSEVGKTTATSAAWTNGTLAINGTEYKAVLWIPQTKVHLEHNGGTNYCWQDARVDIYTGTWAWFDSAGINWQGEKCSAVFSITSDNEAVVKYENGNLAAKGTGTATVTVQVVSVSDGTGTYSVTGATDTIEVVVTEPAAAVGYSAADVVVTPGKIEAGQTARAVAVARASDGTDGHTYTYSYSITGVNGASIDSSTGVINTTAGNTGTATVTATLTQVDGVWQQNQTSVSTQVEIVAAAQAPAVTYAVKDEDGKALANVTLKNGETFTPCFTVLQGATDVTGIYTMTLSAANPSGAISINGTTITANKVESDTTVTVTATFAQGAVASVADNTVTFDVVVTAEKNEDYYGPFEQVTSVTDGGRYVIAKDSNRSLGYGSNGVTDTKVPDWDGSGTSIYDKAEAVQLWTFELADAAENSYYITYTDSNGVKHYLYTLTETASEVRTTTDLITGKATDSENTTRWTVSSSESIVYINAVNSASTNDRTALTVQTSGGAKLADSNQKLKLYSPVCSSHSYQSVVTEPTCTSQGYTTHTCSSCGYSYQDAYTEVAAHQYEDGICSVCGDTSGWSVHCENTYLENRSQSFEITTQEKSWSFTVTKSDKANNDWDSALLLVDLGDTDGVVRMDSWAWIGACNIPYEVTSAGTWTTDLTGEVVVTAQRVGDNVVIGYTVKGYTNVYILPMDNPGQTPTLAFSGEKCTLTGLNMAPAESVDISRAAAAAVSSVAGTKTSFQADTTDSNNHTDKLNYEVTVTGYPEALNMAVGEKTLVYALPDDAKYFINNYSISYRSEDTAIATVDSRTGEITAVAGGITNIVAEITITEADGKKVAGAQPVTVSIPVIVEANTGTLQIPTKFQIATEMEDGQKYLITNNAGAVTAYWDGTNWGKCEVEDDSFGKKIGTTYTPELKSEYEDQAFTLWTWEEQDTANVGYFYVMYNGEKWYLKEDLHNWMGLTNNIAEAALFTVTITQADGEVTSSEVAYTRSDNEKGQLKAEQSGQLSGGGGGTAAYLFTPKTYSSYNLELSAKDVVTEQGAEDAEASVKLTCTQDGLEDYTVSYQVLDDSIASIDENGKITPKKAGTTQVLVTLETVNVNGKTTRPAQAVTASFQLTVETNYSIAITEPSNKEALNMAMDYTAAATLSNTQDTYMKWWTSNPNVLTVYENGKINMVGAGTATITASLYQNDGTWVMDDTVTVTVEAPTVNIDDMVLVNGQTGGKLTPVVQFQGTKVDDLSGYTIEYAVTDGSAVSVGQDGSLTTQKKGDSTVTVYIKNSEGKVIASDDAIVEVLYITTAELNNNSFTIYEGEKLDAQTLENLKLTVHWSDGPSETVTCNSAGVTIGGSIDTNRPGTYVVPITYTKYGESITVNVQVVVKEMPGSLDWQPVEHQYPVYQRVDEIQPDTGYVIGAVNENGDMTVSHNMRNGYFTPIDADWKIDPNNNTYYYSTGEQVNLWYFEEKTISNSDGSTSTSYYMYFYDASGEKTYTRMAWNKDEGVNGPKMATFLASNKSYTPTAWSYSIDGDKFSFTTSSSTKYTNWAYRDALFRLTQEVGDEFYLYGLVVDANATVADLYAGLKGKEVFDYIHGEVTAAEILKQVQGSYDVFLADDQTGTNETHLPWSSDRISYQWVNSSGAVVAEFDPDVVDEYSLYVLVDGQIINQDHAIHVHIHENIDHWSLSPTEITVPLNGEIDLDVFELYAHDSKEHVLVTRKGAQIEFDFADATDAQGKKTAVDTSDAGAVYTVPVMYQGQQIYDKNKNALTITVKVSSDPYEGRVDADMDDYPGYPAEGSVKFDKNVSTDGTFYNQTGVAQLELTAAGVTTSGAVDVILIVDISNSMAWTDNWFDMSIYNGDYPASFDNYWQKYQTRYPNNPSITTAWEDWTKGVVLYSEDGETKLADAVLDNDRVSRAGANAPDKLDAAMDSASAFAGILLGGNSDNTLSLVTFAGMDHEHNAGRNYIDSVHSVFTGISDVESANRSFIGIDFYQIDRYTKDGAETGSVGYYLTLTDAEGNILAQGQNRGNTNYDYAFGQAYETVVALKAQMAAKYDKASYEETGRQLHVVFMTDGAPSQYNGVKYDASPEDYLWGLGVTGQKADQYPYFQVDKDGNGTLENATDSSTDGDWLKRVETYNALATKLVEEGGLDGFHAVGFDMAHGGFSDHSWESEELLGVISGLLRNRVVDVKDATSGSELIRYYTELAQALTFSGTDAKVTDVIGSNFTLYTGTQNEQTDAAVAKPSSDIWIKSYRLVTMADVGSSMLIEGETSKVVITQAHVGKRVMKEAGVYDCELLEHVTFETSGNTTTYTSVKLATGEQKMGSFAVNSASEIKGHYFVYTKDSEGIETIKWELGDITDREVALSYYVYLKGSMDPALEREGGTYDTNEIATLEYVDNQGRHASRIYKVPNLPWDEASVTVRFFLVNEKGEYVNFAGTAFDSESLRVFLTEYYVYSGLELSGVDYFTSEQAYADAKVTKYPLYDDAVTMTVYRNPSSKGSAFGSGHTIVAGNTDGKKASQELIKFVDTYEDGSYVKTVIEIPVVLTKDLGESLLRLEPTMVVVDYGKPIDINVISEGEAPYVSGWHDVDIRDQKDYWYEMQIIGFATYSDLHDQKDYVREDSISSTLTTKYGTYSLVKDGHSGFQVRFTPSRFFEEPENVFVGVKFAKYECTYDAQTDKWIKGAETSDYFCMYKQLSVVPATVMYYETDFADNVFILHQGEQIHGMNYTANMRFTPQDWLWSDGVSTNITGPGNYTMTWTPVYPDWRNDKTVSDCYIFAIEIPGAGEAMKNYRITNMTLTADGVTIGVDESKIHYEAGTDLKIIIVDPWIWANADGSQTVNALQGQVSFTTSLVVNFTITDDADADGQVSGDTSEQASDWTEKTDSDVKLSGEDVKEMPGNAGSGDWDHIQNDGPVGSGKGKEGDFSPDYAYGYDSTYGEDNLLSDGDSWFVKGTSTAEEILNNDPSTYATFTFTGTGFDLISRTGDQQATLRIHVIDSNGTRVKTIGVIDKGANELYQIPVISVNDLPHGTYTVEIIVYESFTADGLPAGLKEQLARGNEFYFDAIRIYDPVAPETVVTQDAQAQDITVDKVYSEDGENEPVIIQIGALLMDLKDFEKLGQGAVGTGAVYMDAHTLADGEWVSTDMVQQYQDYGPNNEVYLKPGQGIAFILNISDTIPASLQIGAKSIEGNAPIMKVEVSSVSQNNQILNESLTQVVATSTAMYYKAAYGTGLANLFGDNKQVYVFIWNASADNSILSVTDVKIGYASEAPKAPVSVGSSHQLVEDAAKVMVTGENKLVRIDDAWYYCNGSGAVITDYTGLVITAGAGTWYVKNGKVDFTYNGMYEDPDGTKLYYIRGGMVDETLDGIASRGGKWMYFVDGVVDTTFTGIVSYGSTGQWYVENGIVRMDFSGKVTVNGVEYNIQAGKVVS